MTVEVTSTIEVANNKKTDDSERVSVNDNFEVTPDKDPDWITVLHEFTRAKLDASPVVKRGSISSAERTISYLDQVDGIISRVIRADVNCDISSKQIVAIDLMRSEIASKRLEATNIFDAIQHCRHTNSVDRTDVINESLGKKDDPPKDVRHEVCKDCGRINTITSTSSGDHHSISGKTYKPDSQVACVKCETLLYKNASGDVECLTCNIVMSKKASTPRSSSRFVTDPFMHAVAQDIINSKISSGYNLEDGITKAVKDWELSKREQFLLRRTMHGMGMEVGQLIWLAPAQTTYANAVNLLTKKGTDYSHVDETLQHDDSSFNFFISELERQLAEQNVDLSDLYANGKTSEEELRNIFIESIESRDRDDELLHDPMFEYKEDVGLDLEPYEESHPNIDVSTLAAELAEQFADDEDAPQRELDSWKGTIVNLLGEKFERLGVSGQQIYDSIDALADFSFQEQYDSGASTEQAARDGMITLMSYDSDNTNESNDDLFNFGE